MSDSPTHKRVVITFTRKAIPVEPLRARNTVGGSLLQGASIGYDPSVFTHYKGAVFSFDGLCYNAINLYAEGRQFGGVFPKDFKTRYATDILKHHPEKSLSTARNLVSIASKLQLKYSDFIGLYYKAFGNPRGFLEPAEKALAKRLKEDLDSSGYQYHINAIQAFLNSKR